MSELIPTGVTFGTGRQSINNAFSGEAQFNIMSAVTYYSGSTDLSDLFANKSGDNYFNSISANTYFSGSTPLAEAIESSIMKFNVVTYEQLLTLINTSALTKGDYYSISNFQTIHKIPYTTDINTGSTETLITQALSESVVDHNVKSLEYPMDTIYWDPIDNQILPNVETRVTGSTTYQTVLADIPFQYPNYTGNGITTVVSLGGRPGRIYYRKDNLRKLETGYDFRNVKFRRWKIAEPYVVTSAVVEWDGALAIDVADILSGSAAGTNYYLAKTNYTTDSSETSINDTTFNYKLDDFFDKLRDAGYNSNFSWFGGSYANASGYTSPTPDNMVILESTFGVSELTLSATNQYIDVTTFDNNVSAPLTDGSWPQDYDDPAGFRPNIGGVSDLFYNFNISIKPAVGAYLEQVDWEYYPNITFFGMCNNINIGTMTSDATIFSTANAQVGNYCQNLLLKGHDSSTYSINIGDFNRNVFLSAGWDPDINLGTKIGDGNLNIIGDGSKIVTIGSRNENVFLLNDVSRITVGNNNRNTFFDNSNFCSIENINNNVSFFNASSSHVGDSNNNIYVAGVTIKIGNNNFNIKPLRTAWDAIEGVIAASSNSNVIGNNCNTITMAGQDNNYGDNINNLICYENVSYSFCNFESNFSNVTFKSTSANSGSSYSFTYSNFENISMDWVSSSQQLEIDLDQNPLMDSVNFNIQDRFSPGSTSGLIAQYMTAATGDNAYLHITGTTV